MTLHTELATSGYRSLIQWPVQWGDQDAFGHVNHTVFIRWFESSRFAYLEQSGMGHLLQEANLGPILAAVSCNYRRQLRYPDTVWVGTRVVRLGNSSLRMHHALWSEAWQAIAAEGDSTAVIFDYRSHRPQQIPANIREAIAAFEEEPALAAAPA